MLHFCLPFGRVFSKSEFAINRSSGEISLGFQYPKGSMGRKVYSPTWNG